MTAPDAPQRVELREEDERSKFVQPTGVEMQIAEEFVNRPAVVGAYASCEWDELDENGQLWIAALVREVRAAPGDERSISDNQVRTALRHGFGDRTAAAVIANDGECLAPRLDDEAALCAAAGWNQERLDAGTLANLCMEAAAYIRATAIRELAPQPGDRT